MKNGKYDVLFIDFYGTLVTGDRLAVEETCRRVIEDHGLKMTAPELAIDWGTRFFQAIETSNHDAFQTLFECECRTLCETIEPIVGPIDPEPYARMLKSYWSDPPLADRVLEALSDVRIPICIVSNADTEDVLSAIERRRLPITEVVTSEDARSYKPDAVIFQTALRRMNVEPARAIHVGDSLHSDVGGAGKLGIATCWVCYEDRIHDVGTGQADHQVANLMELHDLL